MARPRSADLDELVRIHRQNMICSEMLLKALQLNHGDPVLVSEPEPDPEPEPLDMTTISDLPVVLISTSKVELIKRAICKRYGISKADIESDTRRHRVAIPRQIGMYLANKHGYSFPEVSRRFGGRHHTTTLHACRKIARLATNDTKLATQLAEIEAEIRE